MKRLVLGGILAALTSVSFASERAGIAIGDDAFTVTRETVATTERAKAMTEIKTGDALAAKEAPVRFSATNGSAVLVAPNTHVAFPAQAAYELNEGSCALTVPKTTSATIKVNGLILEPVTDAKDASDTSAFIVNRDSADHIVVRGLQNRVTVKNAATGEQLGLVGPADTLAFTRAGEAWKASVPRQGAPGSIFRMQTTDQQGLSTDPNEEENKKKGAYWWTIPAIGLAGLGIYYGEKKVTDDGGGDDNNNDKFPRSVVIQPR